ncbi:hypothetical protein HQ533_04960 [Candidatus Woesearchaeota archaeon]|nr:hypothetical protein [Candidatus Woesearchaeota archaeon]
MKKTLGFGYTHILYKGENDTFEMNYSRKDLHRMKHIIKKKLEKDKDYFLKVRKLHEERFKKLHKEIQDKKKEASEYTDKELMKMFKLTKDLLTEGVGEGHMIEPFAIMHDHELRVDLAKHIKNIKELNRAINVLTTSSEKSFAGRQQEDLIRISKTKNKKERETELQKHLEKFSWIKNNYSGRYPLTMEEVEEEIKSLKKKKHKEEDIEQEKKDIIEKYKLPLKIITLCKRLVYLTNWQDKRKELILKGVEEFDIIIKEAAKRAGVKYELFKWASHEEVEKGLTKDYESLLEKRRKFSVLYRNSEDEIQIAVGEEAHQLNELMKSKEKKESKTINGMCASLGKVIAKVQICRDLDDIANFKEGNVLVTSMTRPEFVPAMKKAAAVITDEGGITCHAAIVSRELGIPCVIGTQNATKVLNDNELVEVNANHGVVRIVK